MKSPLVDFFPPAVAYLIHNEIGADKNQTGGFTNSKDDRGKSTKWGCTQKTLSAWRGEACTSEDVKNLERSEAENIYRVMYWQALSCHLLLKPQIATALLDLGCLFGVGVAARHAQIAAQAVGCTGLKADGVIGPNSIAALNIVDEHKWLASYQALFMVRIDEICRRDPSQIKWINGWTARVEKLKEVF